MKTTTDLQLIEAACQGDPEALEALLLQYHPMVTRFARKYCATPEDVEDAVQETLWIAAQKIDTLRVTSAFISWVFQVVRRQCFRLLRIQQRETPVNGSDLPDQVKDNPEHSCSLHLDVAKALAGLPPTYREVLILRDLQGLTAPEVAAMLGVTIETVKSRLHRARNLVRQTLE